MSEKSLSDKLKNSKFIKHIVEIADTITVIVCILLFIIMIGCVLVSIGLDLFKLSNKIFFSLYILAIFIAIISWIGYSFTAQKSILNEFFQLVLATLGLIVTLPIIVFAIGVIILVGYAIWNVNWLLLLLYIPVVLAVLISIVCDVLDI